jgi:hypothetical protein
MLHWDQNSIEAHRQKWNERGNHNIPSLDFYSEAEPPENDRNEALASGFIWGVILATFLAWTSGEPQRSRNVSKRVSAPDPRLRRVPADNPGKRVLEAKPHDLEELETERLGQ